MWSDGCADHRLRTSPLRAVGSTAGSGAVPLSALLVLVSASGAQAQSFSTLQLSRQLQQEDRLEVEVDYAAGRFTFGEATEPGLYSVRLEYDEERFEPVHVFEAGRLVVGVDHRNGFSLGRGSSGGELDLSLSGQVPLDLDFEFGAVRADLDLSGLRLDGFQFTTGASEATIRVSEPNPRSMRRMRLEVGAASVEATGLGYLNAEEVTVDLGVGEVTLQFDGLRREETRVEADMGLGSLTIRVPRDAGIRLVRESFLTSLDAPDLDRRGDVYYSSNWDTSERRVLLDVEAAFGSVTIERLR